MVTSRWPLFGLIAAGALAAGSCVGALVGHFTVTGGLYPGGGWDVPSFGTEVANAELPPAAAKSRTVETPHYVGYYPDQASDVAVPARAEAVARDYDALFDEPAYADASYAQAEGSYATAEQAGSDWPPAPAESADVRAYSERAGEDAAWD
jgi:hypothetical protein